MPRPRNGTAAAVTLTADVVVSLRDRLDLTIAGDRDSLGGLFVLYGDMVFAVARRYTRCSADAEDVTQDLFVRLPMALRGFTGATATFPAWLRRVAVRQALVLLRSGRRRREVSIDGVASLVARADHVLDRLTIQKAVTLLSEEHRTVFLLRELEGFDHREIAEALGISVANSEVRLHRARRQLRDLLRGST
ncbi:MAG: sigma-70 family RNA polymerase sigma factor [Gemmatimonadaceae bacterium]|nr:sigma-70 family RNA polymerase sigma factor [Gemmatimonadaceae bacterium]